MFFALLVVYLFTLLVVYLFTGASFLMKGDSFILVKGMYNPEPVKRFFKQKRKLRDCVVQ
jgi:hypothetical protein